MSLQPEQKKRPAPIAIPQQPPPRTVPGPNAFTIAAKAKQNEVDQRREAGSERPSAHATPVASPLEGSHLQLDSQNRKDGSSRSSAMTTFTNMIDAARGSSPRKSDGHSSSIASRHGSTSRSRHSNKSHRSTESSQRGNTDEDRDKTARSHIEAKAEKKFFKMMGQIPVSPSDDNSEAIVVETGHYTVASKDVEKIEKKVEEGIKSPKKKLFGMSIPSFKVSGNSTPAPPMPIKAAQVFGTGTGVGTSSKFSPASKRRNTPRPFNQPPRSDTAKSLPVKLYDQESHLRRPNHNGSKQSPNKTPSRKVQQNEKSVQWMDGKSRADFNSSSSDLGVPPTPPAKDTPRDNKGKAGWMQSKPTEEIRGDDDTQAMKEGVMLQVKDFSTSAEIIPSEGGQSPTKFCPATAEQYVKLIEPERVLSAHAQVDDAYVSELEGDSHQPLFNSKDSELQKKYPKWWEEQGKKRFGDVLTEGHLPPTFYSPSTYSLSLFDGGHASQNTNKQHLLFAIPPKPQPDSTQHDPNNRSIDVIFQGEASEIDPTSEVAAMIKMASQNAAPAPQQSNEQGLATRVMQELQMREQEEPADRTAGDLQHMQPEQSSSKLTDILSGVSPSKSGYNISFYPNCPSALPSPLYAPPGQMLPPPNNMGPLPLTPPQTWPGTLSDGSNILTHFYMCNSHIDVLGRTLYDLVVEGRRETVKIVVEKQQDTCMMLEEGFQDIKSDIEAINQSANRTSEQTQAINAKLDRLLDYIKTDVAEPLARQTRKNAEMENNIKALQKSMQDLQKAMETKLSSPPTHIAPGQGSQNPFSTLPMHRSQPSLAGFFDPVHAHEPGRDGPSRMPSIQENRNENRFRPGNNGQHWYRPGTAGRENKDENQPFSPPTNPYLPQYNSGYMGGYGGYYPGGPNEQNFSYNPGNL